MLMSLTGFEEVLHDTRELFQDFWPVRVYFLFSNVDNPNFNLSYTEIKLVINIHIFLRRNSQFNNMNI